MKKNYLLIVILLSFTSCFAQVIIIDDPKSYMPDEVGKITIGMSIADFKLQKDTSAMVQDLNFAYSFIAFTETLNNNNLKSIYYKFDVAQDGKNTHRPLYEMRLEFADSSAADLYTAEKFKGAYRVTDIAEKEWFLATDKDYWLLIRKSGTMVNIAAMMSGTEWGFE